MLNLLTIPPTTIVPDIGSAHQDELFDPELDYAQVLAEARSYIATHVGPSVPPLSNKSDGPQLTRSASVYRHGSSVDTKSNCSAQVVQIQLQQSLKELKSSRSWKSSLLFWRKPKKHKNVSNCDTPQHPAFWPRSTSTSAPPSCERLPKKINSGPIYTSDIPPVSVHRSKRPLSGPLSGTVTPVGKNQFDIPYKPLRHHASRVSSKAPLYTVS